MTDDNLDLETLRARIRSLEAQLSQSAGRDQTRGQVAAALTSAGVKPSALQDAIQVFESQARLDSDGWRYGGMWKASLQKVVSRFLGDRPHLVSTGATENAVADLTQHPSYPKDYRGQPLPIDDLSVDELMELAGEFPKPSPAAQPKQYSKQQLTDMSTDELLEAGGPTPEPKSPERKTYSPEELDRMDNSELWVAAGSFPKP